MLWASPVLPSLEPEAPPEPTVPPAASVPPVVAVVPAPAELSPPLSSPPPPPPPLSVLGSTNSTSGSVISIGISSIGTSSTIISGVGKGAVVKSSSPMVSSIVAVPIKSGSASRETSSSSS